MGHTPEHFCLRSGGRRANDQTNLIYRLKTRIKDLKRQCPNQQTPEFYQAAAFNQKVAKPKLKRIKTQIKMLCFSG
jgi:hypothetical protein